MSELLFQSRGEAGSGDAVTLTERSPAAPSVGVVVVEGMIQGPLVARMEAELRGRIEVGTQVLVVDVAKAQFIGPSGLAVLAVAARRLQEERSGSLVLRQATAPLLRELRLLRLDHVFELEI